MQVNGASGGALNAWERRQERDHAVQDVFSAVLEEFGRKGYASADEVDDETALVDQVGATWEDWFDGEVRDGRFREEENVEQWRRQYGDILVRAYDEGAYADPKSFLQGLSAEELETVQHVQRLADPIRVDGLTEEGALNLLIPPPGQVDIDHDGFTKNGIATGFRFPDSNTPPEVAAAWDETMAETNPRDRMIHELQMVLPLLTANIHLDAEGRFSHMSRPGDPDFVNPFAADDYSYVGAAQDRLDYLEYFKPRISAERYECDKTFWTEFQASLIKHGAK